MDDLTRELEAALDSERPSETPDLRSVLVRGKRLRRLRIGGTALSIGALIAVIGVGIGTMSGGNGDEGLPVAHSSFAPDGSLIESISEERQAEIFAFRAMADTGLMNIFGKRTYLWTYEDDTTEIDDGWRIGFVSADCEPRGSGKTLRMGCTGVTNHDPDTGLSHADTYLDVALNENGWAVIDAQGNIQSDERDLVVGFTRPQEVEPSHWEFPAIDTWPTQGGVAIEMIELWVGPYPTGAPGSVCTVEQFNAAGDRVQVERFYLEPPNRPFGVAGGIRGVGAEGDVTNADVECSQGENPSSQPSPDKNVRPTPESEVFPLGSGLLEGEGWGDDEGAGWLVDSFRFDNNPCVRWLIAAPEDQASSMCIPRGLQEEVWGGSLYELHGSRGVVGGVVDNGVSRIVVEGTDVEGQVFKLPADLFADFKAYIVFLPDDESPTLIAYNSEDEELGRRTLPTSTTDVDAPVLSLEPDRVHVGDSARLVINRVPGTYGLAWTFEQERGGTWKDVGMLVGGPGPRRTSHFYLGEDAEELTIDDIGFHTPAEMTIEIPDVEPGLYRIGQGFINDDFGQSLEDRKEWHYVQFEVVE